MNAKLRTSIPYFLLAVLLTALPLLNHRYPSSYFPSLPPLGLALACVLAGAWAAFMGSQRLAGFLHERERSRDLIQGAAVARRASVHAEQNDIVSAGRNISRLSRNVDEDLREITPDFSVESLRRLEKVLPLLVAEVRNEGDARVRLGVVGTYLGETLCRHFGWQWLFRADLSLRQFSYLASVLRKSGKELDPYSCAADLLTGKGRIEDILGQVQDPVHHGGEEAQRKAKS